MIDGKALTDPPARTLWGYRWWIVVLLFFSTTINYVDRQLFPHLIPYFEDELRIGPLDLAYINVAFLLSYGLGMMFVGRFIDRVGTRVGLAITFLVWNLAAMSHGLVATVAGFVVIRIILGIGEAGNFPAAVKTVAEWFPRKERALATGWFNCGSNIGAVITPPLVVAVAAAIGWRRCFMVLGAMGLVWLFFWIRMYRRPEEHPKVQPQELDHIRSDPPDAVTHVPVLTLLSQRQVYAIAMARFFTEAPWWFYLTWMPKLLTDQYGMSGPTRGLAIAAIYLIADFGAIGGGWISSHLLKRGRSVNFARKTGLLVAALGTVPIISVFWLRAGDVAGIPTAWIVVALVALAASSHQAWSSNMFTVVSDTLPKSAVAMTVGIGTAVGAVGSSLFQFIVALWLMKTGNYALPFLLAGTLYLIGLLALHLILPALQPAKIDTTTRPKTNWLTVIGVGTAIAVALVTLQVQLNKPAYSSPQHYYTKRQSELKASGYTHGPKAKVGWQEAQWVRWRLPDGSTRPELIKFDRHGRPQIEGQGVKAKKYQGPTATEMEPAPPAQVQ